MSTPEPETDSYCEPPMRRVKMRSGPDEEEFREPAAGAGWAPTSMPAQRRPPLSTPVRDIGQIAQRMGGRLQQQQQRRRVVPAWSSSSSDEDEDDAGRPPQPRKVELAYYYSPETGKARLESGAGEPQPQPQPQPQPVAVSTPGGGGSLQLDWSNRQAEEPAQGAPPQQP